MNDTDNKTRSEELTSANDAVETTDYDIKVRCTKSLDGKTRSCKIVEILTGGPAKERMDKPPVAGAASRKIAAESDGDCDLCSVLADTLKEQTKPDVAPRRMHSPLGRRMTRS